MQYTDLLQRFHEYLPRFLGALPLAAGIMVGAFLLNALSRRALLVLAHRTRLTEMDVLPVSHVLRWVIRTIAFVLILSVFGFEIGGIWAVLSTILGLVAIGFVAVWSLISHTSATVLILMLRPFQVGDDLEFPGEPVRGRVMDLNFFYTTLVDHDGSLQQIPNNLFFQKTLKRRKNEHVVSLAAQLNSPVPATVELPRAPAAAETSGKVKEADPMMMLPDPASIAPPHKR